jgi:hypothetical protein
MKTREFGQPCAAVPVPGRCRICGNKVEPRIPGAFSYDETLCDRPDCYTAARAELGLRP